MMMIFGTLVENDDISGLFCHFFKILIFWVKEQKVPQSEK